MRGQVIGLNSANNHPNLTPALSPFTGRGGCALGAVAARAYKKASPR
jgi:hypothetical protein